MDPPEGAAELLRTIRAELSDGLKSYRIGDVQGSFVCASHISRVWDDDRLHFLFGATAPASNGRLTSAQLDHLRRRALPLLSFAVYVRVSWSWFVRGFPGLAFTDDGSPDLGRDLALPQLQHELASLLDEGLNRNEFDQHFFFAPPPILRLTNDAERPVAVHDRLPIPLEMEDEGPTRMEEGSYGSVFFCRINPEYVEAYPYDSQQAFRPARPYAVAVKVFNRTGHARLEVENLTRLKEIASHPGCRHPISLHHCIVHQFAEPDHSGSPKPLVIFPFADLGSLWQFLHGEPAVGDIDGAFQERSFAQRFPGLAPLSMPVQGRSRYARIAPLLLEQCLALAGALRFLHGRIEHRDMVYLIAHMDLKPNNIIISARPDHPVGVWKLADFGISVIRKQPLNGMLATNVASGTLAQAAPATIDTSARRGSSTYQAPEIELSLHSTENRVPVGRMSDIWSYGAILAEVLAFAVGGTPAFEEFHASRRGYSSENARSISDFFWEWKPFTGTPGAKPHHAATGSLDSGRDLLQVQQPSARLLAAETTGSGEAYDRIQIRRGVVEWLLTAERDNPDCGPWINCIKDTLKVYPRKRPSAEDLFLLVREVLYPTKQRTQDSKVGPEIMEPAATPTHSNQPNPGPQINVSTPPVTSLSPYPPVLPKPLPPGHHEIPVAFDPVSSQQETVRETTTRSASEPRTEPSRPGSGPVGSVRSEASQGSSASSNSAAVSSFAGLRLESYSKNELVRDAMSVSLDRSRIVYLTIEAVFVLDVQPEIHAPLSSPQHYNLPREATKTVWKGVAVAGDYVVLYGYDKPEHDKPTSIFSRSYGKSRDMASSSLVRILRLGWANGRTSGGLWIPLSEAATQALATFDYGKRVAVSPTGLVAVINGNGREVLVFDASHPARDPIRLGARSQDLGFEDVSFSEDGTFLYASGVGGLWTVLTAYQAGVDGLPQVATASYRLDDALSKEFQDGTFIFPHSRSLGCIVTTAGLTRLLYPLESTGRDVPAQRVFDLRRMGPNEPIKPRLRALTVHGSRILLTVDKDRSLTERFLTGRSTVQLEPKKSICSFEKAPEPGSQLRAYRYDNAGSALVLLCHVGGRVEVVRFSLPPTEGSTSS